MANNRKIVLGIGVIISFILIVLSITFFYNFQHYEKQKERINPEMITSMSDDELIQYMSEKRSNDSSIYNYYLLPFMSFIGVFVGTFIYYIMSEEVNKKNKSLKNNTKIILNFLSNDEKSIIEKLIKANGEIPQYELTYLPGLNKVKTHRILENLLKKGIIKKEKYGKINKIILDKDIFEILKE